MASDSKKETRLSPVRRVVLSLIILILAVTALAIAIEIHVRISSLASKVRQQEIDLDKLEEQVKGAAERVKHEEREDSDEETVEEEDSEKGSVPPETETKCENCKSSQSKSQKQRPGPSLAHVLITLKEGKFHFEEDMLENGMRLEGNNLVVPDDGFYFVYSQMLLDDPNDSHMITANGEAIDPEWRPRENYEGGVVRLQANDRLSVRVPSGLSGKELGASFLGMFYVGRNMKDTKNIEKMLFGKYPR
eukprot:m.172953 g.172953  ORF g.172953 m.172953 type:complete len:248 (+) comp39087_c0_seq43:101-844(+)